MFVASSTNLALKDTLKTGLNKLHDKNMASINGVGRTITAFGEDVISAISDVKFPDWFIVVRTPVDVLFRPIRERG